MIGGPDEIELLVQSGAKVNAIGDMGYTALHYAAVDGRLIHKRKEVAKLLTRWKYDKYRHI